MIIGDPSTFAIESSITTAFANKGLRALGFFVIYVGGRAYGIRSPDASMLAILLTRFKTGLADGVVILRHSGLKQTRLKLRIHFDMPFTLPNMIRETS